MIGSGSIDFTRPGLVVEQRDPRRVVVVAVALVEEEQQTVRGRDRRGAGADTERTLGGPDDRVRGRGRACARPSSPGGGSQSSSSESKTASCMFG